MPSDKALARKKRFLEVKAEHGNVKNILKINELIPYRVWFLDTGEIVSCTQDETLEPKDDWLTFNFSPEQTAVLKNGIHNYVIKSDPLVENKYSIERKVFEETILNKDDSFLQEVPVTFIDVNGVKIDVHDDAVCLSLSKNIVSMYEGISSTEAYVKGVRKLIFYITAKGDPHYYYDSFEIEFGKLLESSKKSIPVELPIDEWPSEFSVFTKKLFDYYFIRDLRGKNNES